MDLQIKGKSALVTGGSHGIGLATAMSLAAEGCKVAICARNADRLRNAVQSLQSQGTEAMGIAGDALVREDISRVVTEVVGRYGTIDILINNVGGGGSWGKEFVEETADEVWSEVFTKNALAAARFTRLVLPLMRKQKWGRVVTVASIYGREGGGRPWFNMAKSAEISLMKSLAMRPELVRDGLTFNSVAPGAIMIPDTAWDQRRRADPVAFDAMVDREFPLGRLGTPTEVANVAVFLCSGQAAFINGACIAADGGQGRAF